MNKKISKLAFILVWAFVAPAFIAGQVSSWSLSVGAKTLTPDQQVAADKAAADAAAKQAEIDAAKQDTIKNMSDLQKKIDKANKAKADLQKSLGQIQQSVGVVQKKITTTKSVITETATNISRKEEEIKNLNDHIALQQEMLKNFIQQTYYIQNKPILSMLLSDGNFSELMSGDEHFGTLDEKIVGLIDDINSKKTQVDQDKAQLAEAKHKNEQVLNATVVQQKGLIADQVNVQGDIAEKEATIAELKQKLTELQNDLNTVTGESYNAKDIKDAIEYANKKTGVPNGILFAFLTQESGRGKNVGQCTYKDVEKVSVAGYKKYGKKYQVSIVTLYKRWDLFKKIVQDLNYSESKKVSCTIPFSKAGPNQGGAMGAAQFMSDTWNSYKSQVAANTGHSNPDPWNLTDGAMALAIKVKNAGGTSTNSSSIKKMVTKYYGASPDNDATAKNYYNNILYFVKNYDKLISN